MDHVDWLDEAAASLLAARLAEQVLVCAASSRAYICPVMSIDLLVFINAQAQLQACPVFLSLKFQHPCDV